LLFSGGMKTRFSILMLVALLPLTAQAAGPVTACEDEQVFEVGVGVRMDVPEIYAEISRHSDSEYLFERRASSSTGRYLRCNLSLDEPARTPLIVSRPARKAPVRQIGSRGNHFYRIPVPSRAGVRMFLICGVGFSSSDGGIIQVNEMADFGMIFTRPVRVIDCNQPREALLDLVPRRQTDERSVNGRASRAPDAPGSAVSADDLETRALIAL